LGGGWCREEGTDDRLFCRLTKPSLKKQKSCFFAYTPIKSYFWQFNETGMGKVVTTGYWILNFCTVVNPLLMRMQKFKTAKMFFKP
jgi:hypothetical protein